MSTNAAGPRAVVVGAGPAGLATALRLERRFPGRGEVLVLDRSGVAASWRARYAELRLNTTRSTSALPGRPIPRSAGRWPSRDDYVGYLEAAASSLRTPPQTGVRVLRVVGDPGRGWTVVTDVGPVSTLNVVVATGHDAIPHIPGWAEGTSYRGEVWHVGNLGRLDVSLIETRGAQALLGDPDLLHEGRNKQCPTVAGRGRLMTRLGQEAWYAPTRVLSLAILASS